MSTQTEKPGRAIGFFKKSRFRDILRSPLPYVRMHSQAGQERRG